MTTKVGIIGTGAVGSALGDRLLKKGKSICYGARDVNSSKVSDLMKAQPGAVAKPVNEAADWSDVVIVAVPGMPTAAAVQSFTASLGPGINKKIIIDATNPLSPFPGLEVIWSNTSGGELLQAGLPNCAVYKAFNTVGDNLLADPDRLGTPVTMFFAGPEDATSKDAVASVIADVGFEPCYVGPIRYARNLEAMAELWIHLGIPPAGFTKESCASKGELNIPVLSGLQILLMKVMLIGLPVG